MADWYIWHGATNNGDGTASNQAASAAATGAWNNLLDVLANATTYGVSAGDVVYVKTATSSTNIAVSTATLNVDANDATADDPITYIFDGGTIWSTAGESGELQFTLSSTITFENYVNFVCPSPDIENNSSQLRFIPTRSTGSWCAPSETYWFGVMVDVFSSNGCYINLNAADRVHHTFERCRWNITGAYTASLVATAGIYNSMSFNHCLVDLSGTIAYATPSPLFFGVHISIRGLRVIPNGSKSVSIFDNDLLRSVDANDFGELYFDNFDIGTESETPLFDDGDFDASTAPTYRSQDRAGCVTGLRGSYDFIRRSAKAEVAWLSGQNFPTYLATLPDGSTKWSHRVTPTHCKANMVEEIGALKKVYTDSAATKTITVEALINDDYSSPTTNQFWIAVEYWDNTTGELRFLSTREWPGSALTSSSVTWSVEPPTYASHNYSKYKFAVTTGSTIKQNTIITVRFYCAATAPFADSYFFVDPSFQLS